MGKSIAPEGGAQIVFEDEAEQSMTPPRARTCTRRGCTPVVRVRGRESGRISMAGVTCYKPGERSRLFYAVREYTGRRDRPKGCGRRDFRDLIVRARIQLGGPIVLTWDNVRLHLTRPLADFIEANAEWLSVVQLPIYAPTSTRPRAFDRWSSESSAASRRRTSVRSRARSSASSRSSSTAPT